MLRWEGLRQHAAQACLIGPGRSHNYSARHTRPGSSHKVIFESRAMRKKEIEECCSTSAGSYPCMLPSFQGPTITEKCDGLVVHVHIHASSIAHPDASCTCHILSCPLPPLRPRIRLARLLSTRLTRVQPPGTHKPATTRKSRKSNVQMSLGAPSFPTGTSCP